MNLYYNNIVTLVFNRTMGSLHRRFDPRATTRFGSGFCRKIMLIGLIPLVATVHAQLRPLVSAAAFNPSAGLIDFNDRWETPNPTYVESTGALGAVTVTTGSGFVGESFYDTGPSPILASPPDAGLTFKPALVPPTPRNPYGTHYVTPYKETYETTPPFSRGPSVLMADFWSNGPVSIRFSTPVAAVGLDLANSYFGDAAHPGSYQIFAYAGDGTLLGQFGNRRIDTNYNFESTYEFVGFATDGLPLIQGLSIVNLATVGSNRIDNLRFGAGADYNHDFIPVPEPSTYAVGGAALLIGLAVLRRRSRAGRTGS